MLTSTAPMWTWASIRPGINVRPAQSNTSVAERGSDADDRAMSTMRSPSQTTVTSSAGSAPVASKRVAWVRARTDTGDLRCGPSDGAGRPIRVRDGDDGMTGTGRSVDLSPDAGVHVERLGDQRLDGRL